MKAFEERFPKQTMSTKADQKIVDDWREKQKEGWKAALEWVLEYIESPNEFKFCLTEDKIKKELEQ